MLTKKIKIIIICVVAFLIVSPIIIGYINYFIQKNKADKINLENYTPLNIKVIDGMNINILEKGEGEPLIFIHGSQMSIYDWRNQVDFFAKDFKVIAVDMPGNGFSDKPDADYSPEYYANFINNLFNYYNISKASIVASSWGGGHALYFALKYPNKVDKLVLSSSCGLKHEMAFVDKLLAIPFIGRLVMNYNSRSMTKDLLETGVYDDNIITNDFIDVVFKPLYMKGGFNAALKSYQNDDFSYVENNLNKLQAPTLLIWGDHDETHPNWMLEKFQKEISNNKTTIIKDSGHMPHEDKPKEFNKAVLDFIKDDSNYKL